MSNSETISTIDCIETLASTIARASPECAEQAMQIVELVQTLKFTPDRQTVQDAIEITMFEAEISDSKIHVVASAVIEALQRDKV